MKMNAQNEGYSSFIVNFMSRLRNYFNFIRDDDYDYNFKFYYLFLS